MPLFFPHRWEHALVAAVIDATKRECHDCYLGRTAIQKIVYFLNVLEVPMRFKFRIHHYGPFCEEVASTLDWLQADAVIKDDSSNDRYSDYIASENWQTLRQQYSVELEEHLPAIQSVVKALGSMEPRTLELIATLHYSFRWVHARGGSGPWKPATVEKFKQIKKNKFSDGEIDEWHQILLNSKLIEA